MMDRTQTIKNLEQSWVTERRWENITRAYTAKKKLLL